jgi:hypothetical protein
MGQVARCVDKDCLIVAGFRRRLCVARAGNDKLGYVRRRFLLKAASSVFARPGNCAGIKWEFGIERRVL